MIKKYFGMKLDDIELVFSKFKLCEYALFLLIMLEMEYENDYYCLKEVLNKLLRWDEEENNVMLRDHLDSLNLLVLS